MTTKSQCLERFDELIAAGESIQENEKTIPGRSFSSFVTGEVRKEPDKHIVDWSDFTKWRANCLSLLSKVVHSAHPHHKTVDKIGKLTNSVDHVRWGISTLKAIREDFEKGFLEINLGKKFAAPKKENNLMGIKTSKGKSKIWAEIEKDYDMSKRVFGKKINFVTDKFKRNIIFRDVEHAYVLAHSGFSKPAVILAGSIVEELLRIYLHHKQIRPSSNTFDSYLKACEDNGLLKSAIHRLGDSVRHFRNIVHLEKESSPRYTIPKSTAKGAVTSIFIIANDF